LSDEHVNLPERTADDQPKRGRIEAPKPSMHVLPQFSNFCTTEILPCDLPKLIAEPAKAQPHDHPGIERPVSTASDPFFIELCAGSARVTTCLQFFGLKSQTTKDFRKTAHGRSYDSRRASLM